MNYFSAKEASNRWGISARRVTRLASEGRIEGAVLVGGSWLIPETAEKPIDGRRKKNPIEQREDKYHFPNLLYEIDASTDIETEFSEEELELHRGAIPYAEGDFAKCESSLEKLLKTASNKYVRFGACYYLYHVYRNTGDFEKALNAVQSLRYAALHEDAHKDELLAMVKCIEASYMKNFWLTEAFIPHVQDNHSKGYIAFMAAVVSHKDLRISNFNLTSHEMTCRILDDLGSYRAAATCHYNLSYVYSLAGNKDMELYHLKQAIDVSVKSNGFENLAALIRFTPEIKPFIEENYSREVIDRLYFWIDQFNTRHNEFIEYTGGSSIYSSLTEDDYKYISFATKGYSTEQITNEENLSGYAVKKKYSSIFNKLNVSSKKELISKMRSDIYNFTRID